MTTTDPSLAPGTEPLRYPFASPTALQPPAEWEQLRAQCPVAAVTTPVGSRGLLLTRYEDVRAMLADPRFVRDPLPGEEGAEEPVAGSGTMMSLAPGAMDIATGEGHRRWRTALNRSFTVKRVQVLQPQIRRIVDGCLDDLARAGAPADLQALVGFPVPVFVICDLLGVPAADRDRFSAWSDRMLNLTRHSQDEVAVAGAELWEYMAGHVQAKREDPGDDLLSELVARSREEDWLTDDILVLTGIGLLVAGHETTSNMIGKMVAMLLARRERWEQLLADPSLVRTAVEEVLRFDANMGFALTRWVTQDIEVAGTRVDAPQSVITSMSSANRDEQVFERADEMDLTRSPNPHLTFGVGPHSCVGQALARTELQTVLTALLERFPTLELAATEDELVRREGLIVGGLEQVPVRW